MRIGVLVDELFLGSKVQAIFARVHAPVDMIEVNAAGGLAADPPDLLVLDLALPLSTRAVAVQAMRAAGRPVIAVGAHVDRASLQWAREAGCAEVLTRGQIQRALAVLAAKHLARQS